MYDLRMKDWKNLMITLLECNAYNLVWLRGGCRGGY